MAKAKGVQNVTLFRYILDFLVQKQYLTKKEDKYSFLQASMYSSSDMAFLLDKCPKSADWSMLLFSQARESLLSNTKFTPSGFNDDKFLNLWDGMMQEAPFSFRAMAIQKFSKRIRDGSRIVDLGCGTGVSLEQILSQTRKKIYLTGIDESQEALDKARTRLESLKLRNVNSIVRGNIDNVTLLRNDLSKEMPHDNQYDVAFMSLLINHIAEEDREAFFLKVKNILKNKGTAVVYQIVNKSKTNLAAMWVMHLIPTHIEYPYLEDYYGMLSKVFSSVHIYLDGTIVVAQK